MKLAPSILSADFANLLQDVRKVELAGCEYLHIDVMDGHFVPNITLGPQIVKSLKEKDINMVFDVHLMIENPDLYLESFAKAGADILTVHQEACVHLHRTIQNIKNLGVKAGVSLNPATSVDTLEYVLKDLDLVLVMSVNPGFGGQSFIESSLEKIKKLDKIRREKGYSFEIQIDGGVNPENTKKIVDSKADVLVAGSAIFNSDDIQKRVEEFRKQAI